MPRRYLRPAELTDAPTISIVTPSYNYAAYLERTIKSVLEQGYPRLEYIVQDGGSTDATAEVLDRYRARLHRCEVRPDMGQAHALNLGFAHTCGEIMAYLNADDLLLPGSLTYVARYFRAHPEVDVIYGHRVLVDERDMEIGRWLLPRHDDSVLSWQDYVPQETLYWRRAAWDTAGGRLDEEFEFALDWDLILRLRDAGARIVRVPRFLGAFRVHPDQKTSAQMDTVGNAEAARIRARLHGRAVTVPEVKRAVWGYKLRHIAVDKLYRLHLLRH